MSAAPAQSASRSKPGSHVRARRSVVADHATTGMQNRSAQPEHLLTIRVPFKVISRGGRKLIVGPSGQEALPSPEHVDSAIVKALARAFRWRKLIETGVYESVDHIARAEKINSSYVSRVIRLTLLAPEIVELLLDGRQEGMQLPNLMIQLPWEWERQKNALLGQDGSSF